MGRTGPLIDARLLPLALESEYEDADDDDEDDAEDDADDDKEEDEAEEVDVDILLLWRPDSLCLMVLSLSDERRAGLITGVLPPACLVFV